MSRIKAVVLGLFALFMVAVLLGTDRVAKPVYSLSDGPPPGHTGAPGEATCILCHSAGSGSGGQFMILSTPANYAPGQTYQIQVRHINDDPSRMRWGFQLTALDATNLGTGTFQSLSSMTRILSANGRTYIEHTAEGTAEGQMGGHQWTLNWTAPPTDVGAITFYAAGNQADGDGTNEGDLIRTTRVTSAAPAGTPTPTATPTSTPTATPTATPTSTPTATPTPQGFESDISPRPNGDGSLLSSDVVQIRRFVVGLDQPNTATNEYQRADAAPIATLGNGILDSSDTVQTRRYVAGLDTSRATGGPTAPLTAIGNGETVLDDLWAFFFGTEVTLATIDARTSQKVTLRLDTSSLNAAAVSFSLNFDSSVLQNPQIVLEDGGHSGSVLTVNGEAVDSGRLGILIDSSDTVGSVLATFDVAGDAIAGETKVEFTDDVAIRSASDSFGQAIPGRFNVGWVLIK